MVIENSISLVTADKKSISPFFKPARELRVCQAGVDEYRQKKFMCSNSTKSMSSLHESILVTGFTRSFLRLWMKWRFAVLGQRY